jgi:hypothetical protein
MAPRRRVVRGGRGLRLLTTSRPFVGLSSFVLSISGSAGISKEPGVRTAPVNLGVAYMKGRKTWRKSQLQAFVDKYGPISGPAIFRAMKQHAARARWG